MVCFSALVHTHGTLTWLKAYITGNALTILGGPNTLVQTIYHDQQSVLGSITICEDTANIAVTEGEKVHVYRTFGAGDGPLKVGRIGGYGSFDRLMDR